MQPAHFRPLRPFGFLFLAAVLLSGCGRTVTVAVPPRVDLTVYPAIGLIGFAAKPADLGADATQKYLGNLQGAQPGIRLLELGPPEQVLQSVGHRELDYQAIRAIGQRYAVAAIMTGTVELSELRPGISISPTLTSASVQAKIDGKMSAKLWETASGATVWTNSSWGNWNLAGASLGLDGPATVRYSDPKEKRDKILMSLIHALNGDFRTTYEKRKLQ